MARARKLGVQTPGAAALCNSLSTADALNPAAECPAAHVPAVLFMVDHAAGCVYMQRVQGHSLKALLHDGALRGAGASVGRLHPHAHPCQPPSPSTCSP